MPFSTRWNEEPLDNVESASEFVSTRAAFVAQTTLYGYVRTRAGTRYTQLFDDDLFAQSLNIAKWQLFLACATDLAGYLAAGCRDRLDEAGERDLALAMLRSALSGYDEPARTVPDWADAVKRAEARLRLVKADPEDPLAAFKDSEDALVHWAPIADELKIHDEGIVRNSIRFKWKDIRVRLTTLLQADAVAEDFAAIRPAAE
ncbi:hypothetical protein [Nisaea sp.]|uniref:hypothetical protein n=1 Tax=Nisaea sp. TaxID=2024842 RepID=UPI003B51B01F